MKEGRGAPADLEAAFVSAAPDNFGPAAGAEGEDSAAGLDGMGRFFVLAAMLAGMNRILVFFVIRCVVRRTHNQLLGFYSHLV
jgi:hypothetical protein